jgi:uncharacterized protein YdbL (DUF1318 family)
MTYKFAWTGLGVLVVLVGCASVEVKAPKEPIKMDIAMRLDVYQHVVKDVDDIESIVEGRSGSGKTVASAPRGFWVGTAYADDSLSSDATEAAYRRRDRRAALTALEVQGVLGEANTALVVVRAPGNASAQSMMNAENSDRMIIYRAIAAKNGSSVQDVQKVYAERIREGLPAGAAVQGPDGSWTTK